jgi:hypothetical protein
MKFYLDTRIQPHPLPQPTTSKFTAQRKRNAKPPYTVYFQRPLLHLQKNNKEITSHPRPIKPPTYYKSCYTRSELCINRQSALGFNKLRINRQSALGFYHPASPTQSNKQPRPIKCPVFALERLELL